MTRTFALTAAIVLSHALAASLQAQSTPYDDGAFVPATNGISNYGSMPNGGFGVGYTQPVTAGSWIMDQYGMVYPAPTIEPAPRAADAKPATAARPAPRTSGSTANRTKAKPRYQLPTGSLGWSGANGVVLYSPEARYESYGSGFGRGPYGVVNYRYMSWGWPNGY
jgi:hypothetical protein